MATAVTGEEGDLAAFKGAEDEAVGGVAVWRFDLCFVNIGEAGHAVQTAAADDANFCLLQTLLSLCGA